MPRPPPEPRPPGAHVGPANLGVAASEATVPTAREAGPAVRMEGGAAWGAVARKLLMGAAALLMFLLALSLVKVGAAAWAPSLRVWLRPEAPLASFGFGWLLAYLVMSGSPVAATGLGLYAAGVLDTLGLYAMVAGSRFGAAILVLLLGFLVALRPGQRAHRTLGLEAGVLSLLVTWTIYGPGVLVGLLLLRTGWLAPLVPAAPPGLVGGVEATFGAAAAALADAAPHPGVVLMGGVVAVVASFRLFDAALPDVRGQGGWLAGMADRVYRPGVMFALGLGLTAMTLSVAVSLGLLVPLTVKGLVRRENLVPYIMGANVGTFLDTLAVSLVVGGAGAFLVVLTEFAGVLAISLVVLGLGFAHYESALHRAAGAILRDRRRLAAFLMVVLICPVVLLLL